ncbi:MAG TPA: serine/threonine-protein kinase [Kofleriaceae bacterium]|nr:serine/threonine-protein kinase [Kofleriaceae bacterium]
MSVGGRYEILGPLGRGGMGRVYRARDVVLGREVALKLLDSHASDELAARFEREARALARLDHPGCVRVLDVARRYLVLELVAGTTLAAALRADGQFSQARALRIARGVLAALAHAHARGVLHRDIKPDNIMLAASGRVVLIDFGLACVVDEPGLTGVGMCLGSPSYIAPERLRAEPYDARADLWSVGVVLYEMLAGARPFVGPRPEDVMRMALERPPRPLRAARRDVSRGLEAVVLRALAKRADARWADAEDLRGALDELEREPDDEPGYDGDAAGSTITMLEVRHGLARRVWAWLRYGKWRWST